MNSFVLLDQSNPAIAMDESGRFIVAWQSALQDGGGSGIYARRFDAAGNPIRSGEFHVNTYTTDHQRYPSVSSDGDGNFIVVWQSPQDAGTVGISARRYDAASQWEKPRRRILARRDLLRDDQSISALAPD